LYESSVGLAETIHLMGRVVAADGDGRVKGQGLEVEAMRFDIKTKMMKHAKGRQENDDA
jgi:hypothetical protein